MVLDLGSLADFLTERHEVSGIVEDALVRVVLGAVVRADLREVSGRSYHDQVLVVQGKNLLGDALDARVDQVESVFARVYLLDDAVVDVDESFLGALDADEHAVEHFSLVHLVRRQIDPCGLQSAGLVANTLSFFNACVYHS
jgi:hypothetical protein